MSVKLSYRDHSNYTRRKNIHIMSGSVINQRSIQDTSHQHTIVRSSMVQKIDYPQNIGVSCSAQRTGIVMSCNSCELTTVREVKEEWTDPDSSSNVRSR